MSRPELDGWQAFRARHAEGGVLDGTVVQVVPFGVFVDLGADVHGLLPGAALPQGEQVRVRVTAVDDDRRRVSLTLA